MQAAKARRRRKRRAWERFVSAGVDQWLWCDGCGYLVYDDEPVSRFVFEGPGGSCVFVGHVGCIAELERGFDRLPIAEAQASVAGRPGPEDPLAATL